MQLLHRLPVSPNRPCRIEATTRALSGVRHGSFHTLAGIGSKHSFHQSRLGLFLAVGHFLSLHNGDGNHVDNVAHLRAPLKHMNRLGETQQDRPDDLGSTNAGQQFVRDIAGLEAREDQYVI